ncbi:MAG: hypothetical protein IPL08_15210 [Saprospiraceae bacterium]|nr:hypothetical protein [Saprospiraceae bacterium]
MKNQVVKKYLQYGTDVFSDLFGNIRTGGPMNTLALKQYRWSNFQWAQGVLLQVV